MKKLFAVLLVIAIALCCTFAAAAADPKSTYPSPTAPTIIPPGPDEPPTGVGPTSPTGTSSPSGTTGPSDTTGTSVTKPTTGTTGTTGSPTTPDGSTVTGTAKPDTNPDSPKTGDSGAEVFVFSAVAMTGACALVLLRKKKDDVQ